MKKAQTFVALLLAALLIMPAMTRADEESGGTPEVVAPGGEEPAVVAPVGEAPKKEKFLEIDIEGFYRLRWTRIGQMDAFPEGPVPTARYWDQRLRLEPEITIRPKLFILKRISLFTMADIYDGQFGLNNERPANLALDERTWNQMFLGQDSDWKDDGFWWRQYWAEIDLTAAIIRVGRMGSNWGQGILANDGWGSKLDFGDAYFGDTVERVLLGTKPIDLISGGRLKTDFMIALIYDWKVIEDATGTEEDDPNQYIIAFLKEPEKETGESILRDLMAGLYYVHREQDDNTIANVVDFTCRVPYFLMDDALKVALNLEGLYIWGETDANRSLTAPEGSDVKQYGFMGSISGETKRLDLIAELGYASGDPNPFDDQITDFHFNRDYNVGLIMFERVISAATANTAYQFASPALSAQAPAGIDLFPTGGSVTNAVYLYPRLKLRPVKGAEIVLGLLKAWAPQDLVDPYRSFLNGGVATNFNGGIADNDLGWEFDVGASYTYGDPKKLATRVGGQWGWFWPGNAFDSASGESMDKIDLGQFRFDILF